MLTYRSSVILYFVYSSTKSSETDTNVSELPSIKISWFETQNIDAKIVKMYPWFSKDGKDRSFGSATGFDGQTTLFVCQLIHHVLLAVRRRSWTEDINH